MFYQAESELGLNFLKTLPGALNETLVFSPISIALVLSLVHAGARGNSKKQIEDTLLNKKTCNNCEFVNHFAGIARDLKKGINGVKVNMANRLYLRNGSTAKRNFLSAISQNYGAEARGLDFRASDAKQKINGYVKMATKEGVDQIINSEDSIENSKGLLINALSFEADFEEFFYWPPPLMSFGTSPYNSSGVDITRGDHAVGGYTVDDIFRVLTLNFKDPRYKLSIFLPKRKYGLNDALKKLDNRRFEKLMNNVRRTDVHVELPMISINHRLSLKNSLKSIGITEMFSEFADLSGITDDAKISEGIHKVSFGIHGSGVSGGILGWPLTDRVRRSAPRLQFIVDHPFLFTVTYLNHSILMGVYRG